jgi:outer membrane protein OmpA-like peptidoglycan-associated protein
MKKIIFLLTVLFTIFGTAQQENYKIKNLQVNTKYSDFGVTYYGDNSAVFASTRKDKAIRKRVWVINNQPYLELYQGNVSNSGEISEVEFFSKEINSKYHESSVAFTKDLKTVYFSRNNYLNKKFKKDSVLKMNLIQMYKAEIAENGEWTNIQPMPFNSDHYQTGHPVLNSRENKLYFVSDMPGSIGLTDIWVVDINKNGSYGTPKNLGPNVNTRKKEVFPYITENDVLYFASEGFKDNYGGLDIYATKILGDEAIEEAKNLEYPINSENDDFAMVFQKGKRTGHFSSNRKGGKGDDDIYFFEELKPVSFDCIQIAQGTVREKETNQLISEAKVNLYNNKGEVIETVVTDQYGTFSFNVDCLDSYRVLAAKENYSDASEQFRTSKESDAEFTINLIMQPDEFINIRGLLMININPIYFDLDKSDIREDAAIELEKVARIMKKYPELKIELGSHTDSRAPDAYNMALSERRAKSTLEWLIGRGVNSKAISSKGYGETQLVNKCSNGVKCSDAEHQLNRRTEFVIVNPEAIKN